MHNSLPTVSSSERRGDKYTFIADGSGQGPALANESIVNHAGVSDFYLALTSAFLSLVFQTVYNAFTWGQES